jgi:hypothetical protein
MPRPSSTLRDPGFLEAALEGLLLQKERIEAQIREVRELLGRRQAEGTESGNGRAEPRRRQLSDAARKRIAAAQKRRWAEYRKQHGGA